MTYGIGAIGGVNYNDPYVMALLQSSSYNPNFQAAVAAQASQAAQTVDVPTAPIALPKEESDNTALWVGGALVAAAAAGACILAHKNANGKGLAEGFKNLWGKIKGKTAEVVKGTEEKVTKNLTVIKDSKGKVKFLVPGKTKSYSAAEALDIAKENGIDLKKLTAFREGKTTLTGGIFKIDGNTVTFKDGKATKIINSAGEDISELLTKKAGDLTADNKDFLERIKDFIADAGNDLKFSKDGLIEADVTRQIGDDILRVNYGLGRKHQIKGLTTLEQLSRDSDAVKNYLFKHPDIKAIVDGKEFKAGKILIGKTPDSIRFRRDGKDFLMENGEIQGFWTKVKGKEVFFNKDSEKFGAYMADNSEKLAKYCENMFKDGKIPRDVYVRMAL